MTPIVAITMLVAAFCGLAKRLVGSVVGAFLLAMIGLAQLLAPHLRTNFCCMASS